MSIPSILSIKNGSNQILVETDDVIWIEAHEQFSYIKIKGDIHKEKKYITKSSLKKIELLLCTPQSKFTRVSKFFIINMHETIAIEKVMTNGNKKEYLKLKGENKLISIGRGYKKNLKEFFWEV